ncbi:hypothetical protein F4677DRAFT_434777 [Hypoxylon crocopeplum]|nr:hypothetical protein F4677DRAFT_434777 [Hypoxylon crocopeplum]
MSEEKVPSLISTGVVVVSALFPIVSAVSVYLRYRARLISRQDFRGDDWWIIATWILSLSLSIGVFVYAHKIGIDYYSTDPLSGATTSSMCLVVVSLLYGVVVTCVKISILLFYKRIFVTRTFQIAAWSAIAFVSLWGVAMFLVLFLQGDPTKFESEGTSAFRLDPLAVGFTQVGSSAALDILVLFFPLPVIFRLQMPLKKKILLGMIFWLGIFCCIAAVVRLVLMAQVLTQVIDTPTQVSRIAKQFIFLILEPHCSIIAACLPCYGPLFSSRRAPESIVWGVRQSIQHVKSSQVTTPT